MSENDALVYYARPGVMTEVGEHGDWLEGLPTGIEALCRVVQGIMVHPLTTRMYEIELTAVQRREVMIRPVRQMLGRLRELDDRPLTVARPANERLVGNCRDFATMFCALLRHQGRPARVRVGFASYLGDGSFNYDHWVTEVWSAEEERWLLVDPEIDDVHRQKLGIEFDTCDLRPEHFYTAGRAWQLCRDKEMSSALFGHSGRVKGLPFVRRSLLQDLLAANKIEVLPADVWWELGSKKDELVTAEERVYLDGLAALTEGGNGTFAERRAAYKQEPLVRVPTESKLKMLKIIAAESGAGVNGVVQFRPSAGARLKTQIPKTQIPNPKNQNAKSRELKVIDPASIVVRGAAQHNLRQVDINIPRYKLVVMTGVSGSGKSSLAFDTLYAEGQRRYVESLSPFVRRYLEQMEKPKVEYIGGLSPAVAIEQKTISKNPRSTVGTVTEIVDYLRVLFSRIGTQHCPQCGQAVEPMSAQQIADELALLPPGTRIGLKTKSVEREAGSEEREAKSVEKKRREREKEREREVEVVVPAGGVERVGWNGRLIDIVEGVMAAGKGYIRVRVGEEEMVLSRHHACPQCEIRLPALSATLFSPNAPAGMCPECNGLGTKLQIDVDLIVQDPTISILDGAVRFYGSMRKKKTSYWLGNVQAIAEHYGADLELPWQELPEKFRNVLLYGSGEEKIHFKRETEWDSGSWSGESYQVVKGIVHSINRLFRQTKSEGSKRWYITFMSKQPCPSCQGDRLTAEARAVTVGGRTFAEVMRMTIEQALGWVLALGGEELVGTQGNLPSQGRGQELRSERALVGEKLVVAEEVLKEVRDRLTFMRNVGLHYLALDRPAPTLSGGEGQRIRLASQLSCGLVGVLYILDEPSIGLHPRDQRNLLETLLQLRDMGNTVLVVEHDSETMRAADWLVDMGPGAGVLGGEVVAAGTPAEVAADPKSLTGRYLSGEWVVMAGPADGRRREATGWLTIYGARLFNLKQVDARFPLGVFTCVTGVSGSGKSSLVAETLYPALLRSLRQDGAATAGPHDRIEGLAQLDKIINITQDAIGRTPRSNPATYVGVFDDIRQVFAETAEARKRGYEAGRFSFNAKGGRCEACQGYGQKKIEMHFLPDVWVTCQECKGQRFNRHTLEIRYQGKNIADVLEMDVQEAVAFFGGRPKIARVLQTLHDVGLDYVKLGQSATTLSGGEAQRVKLARELCRLATGRTIYILDEPTTGLHFADIQRLLDVLHRLVDAGNTVIVIEHNLDVIKTADWIVDLGPEGGAAGGTIVAEGTPEEVAEVAGSYTGRFLRPVLGMGDDSEFGRREGSGELGLRTED